MQLTLQTFQQLLQRMSAALQSSSGQLVDLSVGSILRALLEANASIGLWVQWLIVRTLSTTRAATSTGTDLDSWMADFMLVRQAATAARGQVTFSRLLTTSIIIVPAGTQVKSSTTGASFVVDTDTSNINWDGATGGYLVPAGVSSIDLPVVAQTFGSSGNVTAGMVSIIATAVPGVDYVSNGAALSGGYDAESDERFRGRFRDYINSRSQATATAVGYAVSSLQQSLRYQLFENSDNTGAWAPGHFLVVVDDGSGQLSGALSSTVFGAIDRVRPIGSSFSIQAPTVISVNISVSLGIQYGPLSSDVRALVSTALSNYIDQLPIGATLSLTRIAELSYRSGHFEQNITSILINGIAADLVGSPYSVMQSQSVTVQ